jgi:hypothetical protein
MRAFFATFVLGGVVFYGAASWAATGATLEPVQGDLWINHGKGFEKVDKRIEAKVGDSIMVNPGGSAKLTYADGCEAKVKPGAVTTIAPLSPCASGSLAADLTPIYKAPAAAPAAGPDWGWWPWLLIPAAGAAVGGCALAGCFKSGGSPPQLYEAPSP